MSCLKYWCSRRGRGSSDLFPWIIKPKLSALAISDVFRNFRKKRTEKMERRDKFSVLIIFSVYHWLHKIVVCFPICRSSWIVNAVDFVIYKRVDSPDICHAWYPTFELLPVNHWVVIHHFSVYAFKQASHNPFRTAQILLPATLAGSKPLLVNRLIKSLLQTESRLSECIKEN